MIHNKCSYLKKQKDEKDNMVYYCINPSIRKRTTIITDLNTRCNKIYDIDYTTKKRILVKNCIGFKEGA